MVPPAGLEPAAPGLGILKWGISGTFRDTLLSPLKPVFKHFYSIWDTWGFAGVFMVNC